MDFELWWLLPIPVLFFGLGWIAARIDIKHLLRESRALPLSYFRGLNFLLNEQPDKAIESFIEVVKVDPQTIDLHFALGSLFRRQGEIERATRMHQNLLDRPNLPPDKREAALFELAQDFHRAGLLDRAEELFTKLDGTTFEAYCVDFDTSVFGPTLPDPPGTYDATRGDMSAWVDGSGLPSSGSGQRAAWLYNEFATTFDPDATSDLGKRQRSALQMAIWNGLYDSDFTVADNGLASNTVYFIEDNHALTALADTYLAALLAAGPLVGSSDAAWLKLSANGVDAQDFIGPTSVPEPASVLLLGAGMAALAAFRSRKSLPRRG